MNRGKIRQNMVGSCGSTSKGKKYRLTRNFYKEKKLGELLCEDDGSLVDAEQGALGLFWEM